VLPVGWLAVLPVGWLAVLPVLRLAVLAVAGRLVLARGETEHGGDPRHRLASRPLRPALF
jgi:hypothetical protein